MFTRQKTLVSVVANSVALELHTQDGFLCFLPLPAPSQALKRDFLALSVLFLLVVCTIMSFYRGGTLFLARCGFGPNQSAPPITPSQVSHDSLQKLVMLS